jgi:putative beta-lysine N-acetyltransferase
LQDIIEKLGKSIIQHGPYNRRVYLMKLHIQDAHSIRSYIECLAHNNKYEKIVAKIPSGNKADYKEHGYAQEAIIPEYFKNGEHAVFMAKYFSLSRKQVVEQELIQNILSMAIRRKHHSDSKKNECCLATHICRLEDTCEMSLVFQAVFKTYPFPIFDANYLSEVIKKRQSHFFGIRKNGRIVAIAASEIDLSNQAVEMTDFATLPEFRGQGLAGCLLKDMEQSMKKKGMKTSFSIARAVSAAMNNLFAKKGYSFGGTLGNNSNIAGRIESMNVWHKRI